MSTKTVILRQDLPDGSQNGLPIRLSLSDDGISHAIHRNLADSHDDDFSVKEIGPGAQLFDCAAMIHTENGFICIEAISEIWVQSEPFGFDGPSASRRMLLKSSQHDQPRYFYRLRPGEVFCMNNLTLSIVPESHQDTRLESSEPNASGFESYPEQVSQFDNSSIQPPDPSTLVTPPVAKMLSSPKTGTPHHQSLFGIAPSSAYEDGEHITARNDYLPRAIQDSAMRPPRKQKAFPAPLDSPSLRKVPDTPLDVPQHSDDDHEVSNMVHDESLNIDDGQSSRHENGMKDDGATHFIESFDEVIKSVHQNGVAPTEENEPEVSNSPLKHDFVRLRPIEDNQAREATPPSTEDETQESIASIAKVETRLISNLQASQAKEPQITRIVDAPTEAIPPMDLNIRKHKDLTLAERDPGEPSSPVRGSTSSPPHSIVGADIKILFATSSTVGDSKQLRKFLTKTGVKFVQKLPDSTVLCLGKTELKKTSKLIMAVLLGKLIITDDWISDSAKAGELQELEKYLARSKEKEMEWGIHLSEAIERGRQGVKPFKGWTIAFTKAAKDDAGKTGFDELKEIAMHAGAKSVSGVLPKKGPEQASSTIIIGLPDDPAIAILKAGWRFHTRDIIGLSVLRGELDVSSDEFLVKREQRESKKRKRTS